MTTTITITDAAILAHLSKQPKEPQRRKLTKRLSKEARPLAKQMRQRKTKVTREDLLEKAFKKINELNEEELKNFLKMNCCPHKHTEKCCMDRICKDCGDWC